MLGIIENEAAPVIAGLLRHKDISYLTADDRYKLAVFVAVQRARTFGELERISGMISVMTDKLAAMGATEEQAGETKDVFLRQLVLQMPHIDHLLNKDWYLLETRPEHPFYVSDNPVVLKNSNDFGPYGNIGLAVRGIEIYLPLSSTLMLAMYCPSIREEKVRQKQDLQTLLARAPHLIPRHMRPFETLEHISRFTDYLLMPLTEKHVMHYNALQVEYADSTCFAVKKISLWLKECWRIMTVTGQPRGLRFRANSGLSWAGKWRWRSRLANTTQRGHEAPTRKRQWPQGPPPEGEGEYLLTSTLYSCSVWLLLG